MFERIKLRVIRGRKLKPFAVANVLQDHEDRLKALETASSDSGSGSSDNSGNTSEQTETTNVSFTILNGTTPVEGATVTIGTKSGTTGSAGGCTLQSIALGSQEVTVTCEGYTTLTKTITVTANASITIDDFMAVQSAPSG